MRELVVQFKKIFELPEFDSPEVEKAYWAWNDQNKFAQRRLFLSVGILAVGIVGLLDFFTGGGATTALLTVRLFTILVLTAIYFRFCSNKTPNQRDKCITLFGLTTVIATVAMTVIAPPHTADFYPFLISATMIFGSVLLVPRFSTIAIGCIVTYALYWMSVPFSETSWPAIYANIFVMTATTFSIVAGAFAREKLERKEKLYRDRLASTSEAAISARDAAIYANQAKSHLLANVSHELRTPMNAILGFSEIMKHQLFGQIEQEQYRSYINDIHFAGTLLQANINDLLDVSRLEVGKMSWFDSWSPIVEIVDRTVNTCQNDAHNVEIEIVRDLHDVDAAVYCDPERVAQILINLVTNAVKFSDPGAKITIASVSLGEQIELSVTDEGCGIPPDHIEQIFEPFQQVDANSMTAQKGGMGLGLSIVKELVGKLDGELDIESTVGQGTKVTFTIPRSRIGALSELPEEDYSPSDLCATG